MFRWFSVVFDRYQGLCFCRGVLRTITLLYDRILSTGDPIDRQPSPSPINFIRFVGGCPSIGAPVDRVRLCFEGVRCEIPAALPCFALDTMRVAKRFPTLRLRRIFGPFDDICGFRDHHVVQIFYVSGGPDRPSPPSSFLVLCIFLFRLLLLMLLFLFLVLIHGGMAHRTSAI